MSLGRHLDSSMRLIAFAGDGDRIDHHLMSDRAYEFVRGIRIHDLIRILGTVAHKLREQSTNAASGFCIRRIVSSRAIVRSHMLDPLAPLSARGCCLWLPDVEL